MDYCTLDKCYFLAQSRCGSCGLLRCQVCGELKACCHSKFGPSGKRTVLIDNSVVKLHAAAAKALPKLSITCLQALDDANEKVLANFLTKSLQLLPSYLVDQAARVPKASKPMNCVLAIDIGGTRTKFMLRDGTTTRSLGTRFSKDVWQNEQLPGQDKFDPDHAAERLKAFFDSENLDTSKVDGVVVGVPGTVDLTFLSRDEITTVRNMPSFSPKFIGFDFKHAFSSIFEHAKVSAIADNMAAGLGVCLSYPKVTSGLVLILGTAPAVATFFRDPSGRDKFIETGIWQTWVWFTKIKLDDPYGYTCGLQITDGGTKIKLKPKTATKIPAPKSRIRFALDNDTWLRLIGKNPSLPASDQAHLSEEEATEVWSHRLQTTVNALALQFHNMYGRPEEIHVLGGNSCRSYGKVVEAKYNIPDTHHDLVSSIPVVIQPNDQAQQTIAMTGLINSVAYKVKKVIASGQDPLARGWKRGGEIYTWTRRSKKREWMSLLRIIQLTNSIAKRRPSEPAALSESKGEGKEREEGGAGKGLGDKALALEGGEKALGEGGDKNFGGDGGGDKALGDGDEALERGDQAVEGGEKALNQGKAFEGDKDLGGADKHGEGHPL